MIKSRAYSRPTARRDISRCLLLSGLLAAASVLSPSAAATPNDWTTSEPPSKKSDVDLGYELSAEPGLGEPLGEGSEYYDPGFHISLGLGMRIGPGLLGFQVDYTPLVIDPPTGTTVSGDASLLMLAAAGKVHAAPEGLFDPVFGVRVGYFDLSASGPGGRADITGLALGADLSLLFRLPVEDKRPRGPTGPKFLIGPSMGVSMLVPTEVCLNNVCADSGDDPQGYLQGGLTLGLEHML